MSTYAQSSKTRTIAEIRAANAKKLEVAAAEASSPASHDIKPLPTFEPFKAPKSNHTSDQIRTLYASVPGMAAATPVNSATIAPMYLPPGFLGKLVINPMSVHTAGGHNNLALSTLKKMYGIQQDTYYFEVMQAANRHYVGSGSAEGLVARMKAQIPPIKAPHQDVTNEDMVAMLKLLPSRRGASLSDADNIEALNPDVNGGAHPGAPFFRPGVTVEDNLEFVLLSSEQLLAELGELGVGKVLQRINNPQTPEVRAAHLVMLCPKRDVYEREEYHTKVRPFYVFPSAERVLGTVLLNAVKPQQLMFTEDESSISAFGFSWAHGGADTLWTWCNAQDAPGFKAISWGDDQLWRVTCQDGTKVLVAPDVSGMDMKVRPTIMKAYFVWHVANYLPSDMHVDIDALYKDFKTSVAGRYLLSANSRLSKKWYNALVYHVMRTTQCTVLAYQQYCFTKSTGLPSGAVGTTQVDMVASAFLNHRVSAVELPADAADVQRFLTEASAVCSSLGFPLKDATMNVQFLSGEHKGHLQHRDGTFHPLSEEVRLGLTFIGMRIIEMSIPAARTTNNTELKVLVPQLDPIKAGVQLAYMTFMDKDIQIVQAKQLAALAGLAVQAFSHPQLFAWVEELYNTCVKMGYKPASGTDTPMPVGMEDAGDVDAMAELVALPTPPYFAKIFATSEQAALIIGASPSTRQGDAGAPEDIEEEQLEMPGGMDSEDEQEERGADHIDMPGGHDDEEEHKAPPKPTKPPMRKLMDQRQVSTAVRDAIETAQDTPATAAPQAPAAQPAPKPLTKKAAAEIPPHYVRKARKLMLYTRRAKLLYDQRVAATLKMRAEQKDRRKEKRTEVEEDLQDIEDEIELDEYSAEEAAALRAYERARKEYDAEVKAEHELGYDEREDLEDTDSETDEDRYRDFSMPANKQGAGFMRDA